MAKPDDTSLTVLLTVYNGMPFLPQAVASICAQTHTHFRFLIINNASNDASAAYLESLTDTRIQYICLPTTLPRTQVLNLALEQVQTAFTAIIDADDYAAPQRLATQLDFLRTHPDIALVGSDVRLMDQHGQYTAHLHYPQTHAQLCARLPVCNQFAHAAVMFRTEQAKAVGGYPANISYAQDLALWVAMFRSGAKSASIPQPLASIRQHTGQVSADPQGKCLRTQEDYIVLQDFLRIPDLPAYAYQAALLRCAIAKWQLGRYTESYGLFWQSKPYLWLINPLLWQRAQLQLSRLYKRFFGY